MLTENKGGYKIERMLCCKAAKREEFIMKKLMILGASYSQLPLIYAAKRMGIYTIAVSTPGNWPGLAAADEAVLADISDPQAVLTEAKKRQIDGITTCCLDTGVRAIGTVCDQMGLLGLSQKAAETVSDKYKMKEAFQRAGVQTARHICVHNEEELEAALKVLKFPVVVKAVDLMGSRGIFRCNTPQEAVKNYKMTMEATKKRYCVVEEFIEGILFGAEAMIKNKKLVYCMIDNTESYMSTVPTPIGHSVPFDGPDEWKLQAKEQVRAAIDAVGLDDCPVNCDLIYKDGKVYVIEITGRAGATCLPELIGIYYGIDYYEAIVRLAMDMEIESLFADPSGYAGISHTLMSEREGVVRRVCDRNPPSEDIVDLSFNIEEGELVHAYRNGRDRLGQVILKESSLHQCRERLSEVLAKIEIEFNE